MGAVDVGGKAKAAILFFESFVIFNVPGMDNIYLAILKENINNPPRNVFLVSGAGLCACLLAGS